MATKAFILIETAVGKTQDVTGELRGISAVKTVDTVTGPYDIIAVVSGPDLNAVGDLVTVQIHSISGIVRTVTCLSIGSS